jgi:hypothetical protein
MESSGEHGNEHSGSIKGEGFFDHLNHISFRIKVLLHDSVVLCSNSNLSIDYGLRSKQKVLCKWVVLFQQLCISSPVECLRISVNIWISERSCTPYSPCTGHWGCTLLLNTSIGYDSSIHHAEPPFGNNLGPPSKHAHVKPWNESRKRARYHLSSC